MATPARLLFAVALLPLANCSVNLTVGDDVAISCADDGKCPAGYTCRDSVNRCVPTSATGDGPALVGTAAFDKTVIKEGDTLTVVFALDRQAVQPQVSFAGASTRFTMTLVEARPDNSFTFSYTATGAEPETRDIDVTLAAVDLSGNVSTVGLGKIGFDFTAPSTADFDFARPKPAFKHDDTVSVTGSTEGDTQLVSARLLDGSNLLLTLSQVSITNGSFGRQNITGAIDLTSLTLNDGDSLQVQLDLVDAVGNAATVSTGLLVLDFTPPSAPSIVIAGGVSDTTVTKVSVAIDASGGATQVYLDGDILETSNSFQFVDVTLPGALQVQLTSGSGLRTVQARFRDAAGNESTTAQDTINLAIDNVGPTVISFVRNSAATTNDPTVHFTLTADDNQGVVAYTVLTTSAQPNASSIVTPFPTAQPSLDSTFALGADGGYTLYAWVKDGSDLISATSGSFAVTLDRVVPTVTAFTVSATVVKTGSVGVTMSGSDNVGLAAQCVTESSTPPAASDPCFAATVTTVTLSNDGSHSLYPWVRDLAGNVSAVAGALQRTVFRDTQAPAITAFTLGVSSPSTSLTIPLTLNASDPVPSSGALSFSLKESATPPSSCNLSSPPTSYTAGVAGNHTIYPWACDPAGNISVATTPQTICVDLTPATVTLFQAGQTSVPAGSSISGFVLHASDDCGVVRYYISASSTTPSAAAFTQVYSAAYNTGTQLPDTVTTASSDLGPKLIYVWLLDAAGRIGTPATVSVNVAGAEQRVHSADATRDRSAPAVAMTPSSTSFLVWQDCPHTTGPDCDIIGRFYGSDGAAAGAPFTVNTTTAGDQTTPDVASCKTSGDYVVVWASGSAIKARFFTSSGTAYGTEISVGSITPPPTAPTPRVGFGRPLVTGAGAHPADAVVTWQDGTSIVAARPASDGTLIGSATFVVNGSVTDGASPVVAATSSGQFMIAYVDGSDIALQPYSAAGALGTAITANTVGHFGTDVMRSTPAISMFVDGSAVVAWAESQSTPAPSNDIMFSRIASDGTLAVAQSSAASGATGLGVTVPPLSSPAVMADASTDGFFLAWQYYDDGNSGDNSSAGVLSGVYHSDNTTNGGTFQINDTATGEQTGPRVASNGGAAWYVWTSTQSGVDEVWAKRAIFDLCAGSGSCSH
jgi:hypothetical protein